jgi:hypothetical protein
MRMELSTTVSTTVMDACRGDPPPRYLMCFYHVMVKVLERTRPIPEKKAKVIVHDIYDMHFSKHSEDFCGIRDRALARWRNDVDTSAFATYFDDQWLRGNFSN